MRAAPLPPFDHPGDSVNFSLPRLKAAVLAAGLALLASVAIVTLVPGPWYRLCAQKSFPDPLVAGHVHVGIACVRTYWFHIAAGAGALLASLVALPSPKQPPWPRLLIFVVLCDVFAMWIGGAVVFWVWRDPTMPSALHGIGLWLQWPFSALLMGLTFGNLTTKGFGLAIALPTLAWLFLHRTLSGPGPNSAASAE